MKTKTILTLSLAALPFALFAQESIDYKIFMNSAQGNSALFRGELPMAYGTMTPTDGSTYYAYSDDFKRGSLLFRGKLYHNIFLNLNAHLDELCAMETFPGLAVLVNKNFVDSFSVGGDQFVHYKQEEHSVLQSGYYQVLYSGQIKLYKKIRKQYYENSSSNPFDASRSVQRGFRDSELFYIWNEGKWSHIVTKGDLKKISGEQMRAIDHLLKTKKINFRKNMEVALIETVTYLDKR